MMIRILPIVQVSSGRKVSIPADVGTEAAREPGVGKSSQTRQRILDAAAREFRDKGYAAARLVDIARRAGMQAGSLYYHFPSREALVEEMMEHGTRRAHRAVVGRLAELDPEVGHRERLREAVCTHLGVLLDQSDYASATIKVIGQVPPDIRERQLAAQRAYGDVWRTLLERAREVGAVRTDVDLSVIRMAILGALNWTVEWYVEGGALAPAALAENMVRVILDGISAR
jgi:AcrR family transcriptional regulator